MLDKLLSTVLIIDDKKVMVKELPVDMQVAYFIDNHFDFFRSKEMKRWRMENLYFIINKHGQQVPFKFNKAQDHFFTTYLNCDKPYHRIVILKSRQLGFTTFIALYFLDEIMFNPNNEALQIAHTLKDSGEIFNRKILYAFRNFFPALKEILQTDQKQSKKLQFIYDNGNGSESTSSIATTNSARSGTFRFVHISELGKLGRLSQGKAEEVVTGTLPAVPASGFLFIESTAEGASGLFYDMFMTAWKRRDSIIPELTKAEFLPVFYSWRWDVDEITEVNKDGIIPVSAMEQCEIDWVEYQKENDLSDAEISFYYTKYIQSQRDIDKLHQEYPLHPMEAFLSSGSPFFNSRKAADMLEKCKDDYIRYTYSNGEFYEDDKGDLYIYKQPEVGKRYILGGDVAEGLLKGDYSTACVLGYDKEIKAFYKGHIEPDEYSKLVRALGKKYNFAMLAIESNKDGNWVNTDIRNADYPNIYLRTAFDDITKTVSKSFGWLTNANTRRIMLGEAKKHFNSVDLINCKILLEEILVFIRNKVGKPMAAYGKHDDCVIAWAIAIAILQDKTDVKVEQKTMSWSDLIFPKSRQS